MSNPLKLTPGKTYQVTREFMDYERHLHPIGEQWIFRSTNFVPYHDGLTLHVGMPGLPGETVYMLQWLPDEQGAVIEHFQEYVKEV